MKLMHIHGLFLLIICGCTQSSKSSKITENKIKTENIKYSEKYLNSLLDSLKYINETDYEDYTSPLSRKIISIGKPIIPILLNRINDMTPTGTFNTTTCFCSNNIQPYLTIGDFSKSYIHDIYTNLYLHQYKTDKEMNDNFLNPSEVIIINKIIPNIVEEYKKDTIIIYGKDSVASQNTNMNLYNYFIHNENYKMPEQERRRRYKEEFIKALNKDLLKP